MTHPLAPVGAADESWFGIIDAGGVLQRWDARTLGRLPSVRLPAGADGESPAQAHWQVFSGPGGRLALTRDTDDTLSGRALYLGHLTGQRWTRSDAKVFRGIEQAMKWVGPADVGRWLLADPHHGIALVDADTARTVARFDRPAASLTRFRGVALAPDGARVAVGVDDWRGRDDGGIYILDVHTLTVLGRPVTNGANVPRDVLDWTPSGLIAASRLPILTGARRMRLDPVTGAIAELPIGALRHYRGDSALGTTRTACGPNDRAVVTSPMDASGELVLGVVGGNGFLQYADGHVWCEGAACAAFRCVTGDSTSAPADDPACAALREPSGASPP